MGRRIWTPWARISLIALFLSAVAMVLSAIEPFGIDSAIDRQSRDIVYRIFGPFYADTDKPPITAENFYENAETWQTPAEPTAPPASSAQDTIIAVYLSEVVLREIRNRALGGADASVQATEEERQLAGWQSWRPSYEDHAELISTLASAWQITDPAPRLAQGELPAPRPQRAASRPPPAIFFDFIFLETGTTAQEQAQFDLFRDTVADLTAWSLWASRGPACEGAWNRLACIKEEGGIPLIFAEAVETAIAQPGDDPVPAQTALARVALLAPVRFTTPGGTYPLALPARDDASEATRAAREEDSRPSPAVLLYLSWCIDNPGVCAWLEPSGPVASRPRAMITAFRNLSDAPLSLVWGARPPDHFVRMERHVTGDWPRLVTTGLLGDAPSPLPAAASGSSRIVCRAESRASWATLLARMLFFNVGGNSLNDLNQPCPYHLEVPFSAFAANLVNEDVSRAAFDGRLIVVGTRFRNANDWTPSVVHGLLPGFHQHAMAADNLIQMQDRYIRGAQGFSLPFGRLDTADLMETLVGFLVFLVGGIGQYSLNQRMIAQARAAGTSGTASLRRRGHWWLYLATFGTIALIVVAAMMVQVFVFRLAPLNWIGLTGLAFGFFVFVMRDEIGDDVERALRATPVIRQPARWMFAFFGRSRQYLDMETVGFESTATLSEARARKDAVVATLYGPEEVDPPRPTPGPPSSQP